MILLTIWLKHRGHTASSATGLRAGQPSLEANPADPKGLTAELKWFQGANPVPHWVNEREILPGPPCPVLPFSFSVCLQQTSLAGAELTTGKRGIADDHPLIRAQAAGG